MVAKTATTLLNVREKMAVKIRRHTSWLLMLPLALVTLAPRMAQSVSATALYTVTDLGGLGGTAAEGLGSNTRGQIVGDAHIAGDQAFLGTPPSWASCGKPAS